ncbi:hypothetical protein SMD20_45305 [Nonomuraea sp. LP-02]|uniref:hypothetical protein n=1 Tax=Nonomuraea sp. LP-02 TaxID=3097960 RepID=UPI002E33505A|nr:hypothetical protein [Nonomuraea sp. LP-02]MED7931504.1 hypothetical protein [Nonomuraea sp. LP-02]
MHMTGLAIAVAGLAFVAATIPALPAESSTHEKAAYVPAKVDRSKNKGNTRTVGNYWSKGKSIDSGNFSNAVNSCKSNNLSGGSGNNVNGPQRLIIKRR